MSSAEWKKREDLYSQMSNLTPAPKEMLERIDQYAGVVMDSFQEDVPGFGYNLQSIDFLSEGLNRERHGLSKEAKEKLGNFYGAFLGQTILQLLPQLNPVWVIADDTPAIRLDRAGQVHVAFPITRAFKQIEQGEDESMTTFLLAIIGLATPSDN